jgi:hypothetical protein
MEVQIIHVEVFEINFPPALDSIVHLIEMSISFADPEGGGGHV